MGDARKGWSAAVDGARLTSVLELLDAAPEARVACTPPLTRTQRAIAALLSRGHTRKEIGARLGCTEQTIKYHMKEAVKRIPGNTEAKTRLIMWYRGASLEQLGRPRE